VLTYVDTTFAVPLAHAQLLIELAATATYEPSLRPALRELWPIVMERTLTYCETGDAPATTQHRARTTDRDELLAALVPSPQLRLNAPDANGTFAAAEADWIELDALESLIMRWLMVAAGRPRCDTLPLENQASRGIELVAQAISGRFDTVASHSAILVEWLKELRSKATLDGKAVAGYTLIVDGLAANGVVRAVQLQQSME
jgi:hypothetical protein